MTSFSTQQSIIDQGLAYPCYGLGEAAASCDDLAHHIHWRFGVSEQSAESLASDIYKFIEN